MESKNKRQEQRPEELKLKILLKDAVPSIFPNLPKHFNKSLPERRSESTSKDARFKRKDDANELANTEFLAANNIASLEELINKLDTDFPRNTIKHVADNKLTLYSMKEDQNGCPVVRYSLVINEDLTFSMWCNEVKIPFTKVAHLCKDGKVNSLTGVHNILVILKNMTDEKSMQATDVIKYCISLLEKVIPELDEQQSKKISFLNEQLQLSITHKFGRRYSPDILACTALWKNTSPALYKQIIEDGILTLPSMASLFIRPVRTYLNPFSSKR